ncbi:MAG: (2Fe-2S)-binding protein [Thermoanaerobaculia bacterium]
MIVCICRGVSDREVRSAIDRGASSLLDLMRCGIGDQCGSCHHSLRMMLSEAAAAKSAQQPCPACTGVEAPAAAATA